MLETRFKKGTIKQHFSVSTQHYSFAVEAFIQMAKQFNNDNYEFALHECKTYEIIENVQLQKSELGILYMNSFNRDVLTKILEEKNIMIRSWTTPSISRRKSSATTTTIRLSKWMIGLPCLIL